MKPLIAQLQSCSWATKVGHSEPRAKTLGNLEEITTYLEKDPDRFFEPPYSEPYESLCVSDHQQADRLKPQVASELVAQIAKAAYLETWEIVPVAEICALVSDDADTLATLLLADATLSEFTQERLAWYLQGRLPFGYQGNYPTGEWLIL
ncbi:hypothetical protein K0H59_16965 [Shewanella sp. FJAT-51649]|uniref:hypothetical protein n=1 Tax=Shewanella sp. FJAT-51649 TaxID=2864210 RepID=UPI001C662243|nr:hypothetical protein [Shewanella sp. FJAT-51649]QYJ70698.1 hypothetical protein K0H59_16965 [Shewanella sp. FJAT-51649]